MLLPDGGEQGGHAQTVEAVVDVRAAGEQQRQAGRVLDGRGAEQRRGALRGVEHVHGDLPQKYITKNIYLCTKIFAPMFMDVGGWRNIENIDGRQHKTNIWVTVGNWRAASQLGKQAQVSVLR